MLNPGENAAVCESLQDIKAIEKMTKKKIPENDKSTWQVSQVSEEIKDTLPFPARRYFEPGDTFCVGRRWGAKAIKRAGNVTLTAGGQPRGQRREVPISGVPQSVL